MADTTSIEWTKSRSMAEAPRDGTRILAWWTDTEFASDNAGWVTTWWGKVYCGSNEAGWECPWEWERTESQWGPTHWMPNPPAPGVNHG